MVPVKKTNNFLTFGQIISILAISGGLITGYASIVSRITGLEANQANQEKAVNETKDQVQRLSDKMEIFQQTIINEIRDDKKVTRNSGIRRPDNFMQPSQKAE